MKLYSYPTCSTCKKAIKFLKENDIAFELFHIVEESLSAKEIQEIHELSNQDIKKLFNTSGMRYRELNLKVTLPTLSLAKAYELLASDGMLVKRPLAFDTEKITIGFKEEDYRKTWLCHD